MVKGYLVIYGNIGKVTHLKKDVLYYIGKFNY